MKLSLKIIVLAFIILSCGTSTKMVNNDASNTSIEQDTVRIANDALEYEIIIIEPGFNSWLQSRARPEGYYSQPYLESRNRLYVQSWNQRVMQPFNYNPNLYEMQIDYNSNTNYGYDVNYKLYNYFIYFQITYKQQLTGFIPRI
jgi:hypothetical protein